MVEEAGKEREGWIDVLKGIAILLVVMGHVLDGTTGQDLFVHDRWMEILHSLIYIFHMPLFFLLSGAALEKLLDSKRDSARGAGGGYLPRCLNLLLLYVFWSAVMYYSKRIMSNEVTVVYDDSLIHCLLITPVGLYWYLIVLLYYYLIIFAMRKIFGSKLNITAIFIGSLLISGIAPLVQSHFPGNAAYFIYRIAYHFTFFLAGMIIVKHKQATYGMIKRYRWAIIPAVALLLVTSVLEKWLLLPFLREAIGYGVIFGLLYLVWTNKKIESQKAFTWLGKNSLYIYLTHNYVTVAFRTVYKRLGVALPSGVYVLLCFCVTVLACGVVCVVSKKILPVNLLFQPVKTFNRITGRRVSSERNEASS